MKIVTGFLFLFLSFTGGFAQQMVMSTLYSGQKPGLLFEGEMAPLKDTRFELLSIPSGQSYDVEGTDGEYLLLIRGGAGEFSSDALTGELTPGSIALVQTGVGFSLKNGGSKTLEFYLFSYKAKMKKPEPDMSRSLVRTWENITFIPHDKGGIRRYFDQATSETSRFEMHVTTLNGGLRSHDPHTHKAEEIVLMIEGDTEMQIGDRFFKGTAGDVYFLGSNIPHAIRNTGDKPCMYFAFQWQ